jgi:hypothetical protein
MSVGPESTNVGGSRQRAAFASVTTLFFAWGFITVRCLTSPPNPMATTPCNQVDTARSGTVRASVSAHAASQP